MSLLKVEINVSLPWVSMLWLLWWYKHQLTCCVCANLYFLGNFEGMYSCHVWCSLFWWDIKLCWKPCFSGAVPWSREAVSWALVLHLAQVKLPFILKKEKRKKKKKQPRGKKTYNVYVQDNKVRITTYFQIENKNANQKRMTS